MHKLSMFILLFSVALASVSCGVKGPLYFPAEQSPATQDTP